jgi:hypothetical protein
MDLNLIGVEDPVARDNFEKIQQFLNISGPLAGFVHIDLTVLSAVNDAKIKHGLGVKPLDLIQTYSSGPGVVNWNYNNFDKNFLEYSSTGPCHVRIFIGNKTTGIKAGGNP